MYLSYLCTENKVRGGETTCLGVRDDLAYLRVERSKGLQENAEGANLPKGPNTVKGGCRGMRAALCGTSKWEEQQMHHSS